MVICGIKVTHDGGVAVIADGRLLCSVEVEKLDNGERYSTLGDLDRVAEILRGEGIEPADIDRFVIDGWFAAEGMRDADTIEPSLVPTQVAGRPHTIRVAPYQDRPGVGEPVARHHFPDHDFAGTGHGYASYHHVSNHLLAGYCTSPFAARGEDSLVLVWDGGIVPRLYHVAAATRTVTPVAKVLPITGNTFADFSAQFDPFYTDTTGMDADQIMRTHLSVAGKAMAYAALGSVAEDAFGVFDDILAAVPEVTPENAKAIGEKVAGNRDELFPGLTNADLIATFQAYLGTLLARQLSVLLRRRLPGRRLAAMLRDGAPRRPNLVIAGGCALNIKWNSLLRATGLFEDIWVPPFPNDSGAAIGTATCEMFEVGDPLSLDWDVYCGPKLTGALPAGWRREPCDERRLAAVLHQEGQPVVTLSGRAELGPRALGNRSILAPATDPGMKNRLNAIKDRAPYRPVAPICLESRAAEIFTPGNRDPYMLFEHRPRSGWADRIPAVLHLDGTARLQTISPTDGSASARVLAAYAEISGIPVLCNTSANFNGRGFFPDVASAARWGRTRYIWSDGQLYTNPADPTA